ncbi:hypothetical protein PR003_g4366 [Phytophthora rubi]|uniref:HTH psq-type domain-containing protein n=1 Tax=Phytophthora rubi TaxID=129364 RepID=A0A6A4FYP0_9STRA|nr:hypothetical protein PR002_g4303 [Phytophthora rubi]KAE9352468.1 hypothetical protein PR003_g4366 [Phytophthora rubi]
MLTTRKSKQRTYTIKGKRDALRLASERGEQDAADYLGYPRRTVGEWVAQAHSIFNFKGSQMSKTLKGQGRKEVIPFSHGLVTFMKGMRRDEEVRC